MSIHLHTTCRRNSSCDLPSHMSIRRDTGMILNTSETINRFIDIKREKEQ